MAFVLPAVIALGSLYSAYQSSQNAKKLDAETNAKIDDAVNTLINNYKKTVFDRTPLTREQYRVLGQYAPTIAGFVQEKSPEMVLEANSTQEKQMQKGALQKYQQLSEQGEDAQAVAQREEGMAQAQGQQNRNTQQLLQNYQNQGVGNGGQALSAALQTGQSADAQRRQLSLDVAAQNEQRRTQALGQMASLAGQVRGQNLNVEDANVHAINQFNQRNAQNLNSYNQYVANKQSEAQATNLQNQQNINSANTGANNQLAQYNRDTANKMNTQEAEFANDQTRAIANARMGQATQYQKAGEADIARNAGLTSGAFQSIGNIYGARPQAKTTTNPTTDTSSANSVANSGNTANSINTENNIHESDLPEGN